MRGSVEQWAATLLTLLITTQTPFTYAGAVNRTIDDQNGDKYTGLVPVYQPADGWSYGPQCAKCAVKPDSGLTREGTWHDVSARNTDVKNMTLTFTGMSMIRV
jgi:hypothetical protein